MKKVAIISTRLGGIDGVSIEASKWAKAYRKMGLGVIFIAGSFPEDRYGKGCFKVELADYYSAPIIDIRKKAFKTGKDEKNTVLPLLGIIEEAKKQIKEQLRDIILSQSVDYLSIENALSIPLNIPLGIALTEIISELGLKSVTRHHDLFWERKEFTESVVPEILQKYFPPDVDHLVHVVINTLARDSLSAKKGIDPIYIPNIFDFDLLDGLEDKRGSIRKYMGIGNDEFMFLQPTRIIKRKRIERSVELVSRLSAGLDNRVTLFISGKSEEDEIEYFYKILDIAKTKKINLILNEDYSCGSDSFKGKKVFDDYNIYDIYKGCDLVTLPSDIEGFGNPVIESAVFKRPLFVNRYPVLSDMLEKGFDFAVMDNEITDDVVDKVTRFLKDNDYCSKAMDKNFKIVKKYYSIDYLIEKLYGIFDVS